uniref:UDP N-acetylglucosamine O-acyltransferase C-terminal domain-containing protein n=1 Tax=Rhodosorus marinus TaxID=101924 RepID=A0A7S0BF58_9RHOD|mmetsp:Transcript_12480/g.18095  ORF Transcript_12480/g.18095 Transcript_12480/m.18095 type:complete len:332 (+) Transcript_12480:199-1194(+)
MLRTGGYAAMRGVGLRSGMRWTAMMPVHMTNELHNLAEVSVTAVLGSGVAVGALSEIGPKARVGARTLVDRFVTIQEGVEVGNGVVLRRGSCVYEGTRIGSETSVFENALLGNIPQDKKYRGEPTRTEIGQNSTVREGAIIERGTVQGGGVTKVGSNVLVMSGVYIGHDCTVGDECVIGNRTSLAGHCELQKGATVGGHSTVVQRVTIGAESMVGARSYLQRDVIPHTLVSGTPARLRGLNIRRLRKTMDRRDLWQAIAGFNFIFKRGSLPRGFSLSSGSAENITSFAGRAEALMKAMPPQSSHLLKMVLFQIAEFLIYPSRIGAYSEIRK